jgi:hypothetical protein
MTGQMPRARRPGTPGGPATSQRAAAAARYEDVVGALERAELSARERRLAAESEAEQLLADAARAVATIEAEVPARIERALADQRARHLGAAQAEVAAIEARLAEAPEPASVAQPSRGAVALLVAAVLAEPTG